MTHDQCFFQVNLTFRGNITSWKAVENCTWNYAPSMLQLTLSMFFQRCLNHISSRYFLNYVAHIYVPERAWLNGIVQITPGSVFHKIYTMFWIYANWYFMGRIGTAFLPNRNGTPAESEHLKNGFALIFSQFLDVIMKNLFHQLNCLIEYFH